MTIPSDIPADIYQWAADFWDANLETEQVEMVARAYMAGQGAGATPRSCRMGLTAPQGEALNFIASFVRRHGWSPSYSEIAAGLGLRGRGAVHALVHHLQDRGAIRIAPGRARSITIVNIRDVSTAHNISGVA